MNFDWDRALHICAVLAVTFAATAARFIYGIQASKDYCPEDPEEARIWRQRMTWAVAGELSAAIMFVLVAEAVVIWQGLSGPEGVIIGAIAALLGFPFIAGLIRRHVEKKMEG